MVRIKTKEEVKTLKEGGKRHAFILSEVAKKVYVGVSTKELDDFAKKLIDENNDKAAFLGYTPRGAKRAYPASLCVSLNDEIVHGIPNEKPKVLKNGDVVSLDLGLVHKGLITDGAVTVSVGESSKKDRDMIKHCKEALNRGISAAIAGRHIGDISHAIESYIRPLGYGLCEGLAGHGVGYKVHEDPYVPNEGHPGEGELLVPGMVIAIEPMITQGGDKIFLDSDGYTYKTYDGSKACHFEHTIVITDKKPIVLTK